MESLNGLAGGVSVNAAGPGGGGSALPPAVQVNGNGKPHFSQIQFIHTLLDLNK